nr:DMT family transporter [Polycladospora coralii]
MVLLGASSYGTLTALVKLGYAAGFSAAEITGSQILFACVGMWLFVIPYRAYLKKLSKRALGVWLLSGICSGLTGVFYYQSLQYLSGSLGILLLFQFTWMGVLLEAIINKRAPSPMKWIAMLVILIGTFLASQVGVSQGQSGNGLGILYGLASAATYTLFIHFSGVESGQVPATVRTAFIVTGATVITLIVFPPVFLLNGALATGLWKWAALIGLLGGILPALLFAKAIPYVGTGLASLLGAIELPVAILFAFWLLHEQIASLQWIGIVLVLVGILLSELKWHLNRREAKRI